MKKTKNKWKRFSALASVLCLVFSLCWINPANAADAGSQTGSTTFDIRIVQTNDIHARVEASERDQIIGMDRLSGIAKAYTHTADASLMLDAGDTFHGLPSATIVQGESVARLMKACGYDAMTAGNHDWSYGKDRLKELGTIAGVKMLAGNVVNQDGTTFFDDTSYEKMVEKNGKTLKIGVFGVIDPQMSQKTTPSNVEGLVFQDAVLYAQQEAAALKADGCDIVIALSHTLDPQTLAKQVNGVDVWLCGHEHIGLDASVSTPDGSVAYVSECGHYMDTVGLIDLNCTMDAEGNVSFIYQKTSVDYAQSLSYEKDPAVTALLEQINAENAEQLNREIGTSPVDLDGVWEHLRIDQTNLGNVVTDAYLKATGADIAFENAGGIRASVNAGTITYGDVINISPYGNYIVTKKLTGAQIREMLETSLEIRKNNIVANDSGEWDAWPNDSGSYLQVGGISVEYDMEKTQGSRVVSIKKDGKTLNENEFYTVAVNNYLAESSSFPQLAAAQEEGEFAACDEALIRFFEQGSDAIAVSAADQRMVKATDKGQDTPQVPDTNGEIPGAGNTNDKNLADNTQKNPEAGGKTPGADTASPKTGDNNLMEMWSILLLLSGGAAVICVTNRKNRKKNVRQ